MLSESTAGPILLSAMTSNGLAGASAPELSNAILSALTSFLPMLVVQTGATGVFGAGVGVGKWTLDPVSGAQILSASLIGTGIIGSAQSQLANAVASGLAQAIATLVTTQTVVTGVAMGVETGVVVNCNPIALNPLLISSMYGKSLLGSSVPQLAQGLANGLCTWFSTGVVSGVVTGVVSPPFNASIGTGIGSLI